MKTIHFRLVPDKDFAMFSRLEWDVVSVSFREVLEQGIHPWAGDNQHHDLVDAFLERINGEGHIPVGLREHNMSPVVNLGLWLHYMKKTRFGQGLEIIQENVLFCDPNLDFSSLAEIARNKLAGQWSSGLALTLAERLCPGFQELRRFLKSKDKTVKLSGQLDLGGYDWSKILSVDDFAGHERAIIDLAVSPLNFRNTTFLDAVTDKYRRLRLADSIDHVVLTQPWTDGNRVPTMWQAERQGGHWRLRPHVGACQETRVAAHEFALRWRRDGGNLCFNASTEDVIDMVDSGSAKASFPGLRYMLGQHSPRVTGQVPKAKVPLYVLGKVPSHSWSGAQLKSILREYGAPTSGVKKVLVQRLAKLAEAEYKAHKPLLDGFFSENRFVRVSSEAQYCEQLPVLGRENTLKGLLLHMYALRHLRGNVVIDTSYENDSCGVEELALALMNTQVTLTGGFVRVS